ncbi:MAG: ATP-binding protein [Chitinophagaceae bacterium]
MDQKIGLIVILTLFMLLMVSFIAVFVVLYQKRHTNYLKEKQLLQYHFSQTLLQTQLEIQEQTLKNISQEIHDNIGQVLSLAKLNINTMNCNEPEALQGKINDSKILISKAIQDLRDLSRSLNTDYVVEMGLLRSVEYELELIKRTGVLQTVLRIEGKPYRLEQQQELILFRIVQEILHNILKHAKASVIDVFVQFKQELFTLTVTDNGIGFDASRLESSDYSGFGLGIRNMHNRSVMINTAFALNSTIGKGVAITLQLPINNPVK